MSPKILLIDDEPGITEALKRHLVSAGIDVETIDNGEDGLKEIASKKYDVILLDVLMPEFDGIAVLEELRGNEEKYGNPKVIVITNNSSSDTKEKVESLGVSAFYDKGSMSAATLIDTINRLLNT
jgi:DNA-binding response OmpR family regulator